MSRILGQGAVLLGFLLLFHSGYSAAEHISFLKAVDKFESVLPIEIITECLVGALIAIFGIVFLAGTLKPVLLEAEMARKPYDSLDNRLSFRSVLHRRRAR